MSTLFFAALVTGDQTSGYRATIPDLSDLVAEERDLAGLLGELRRLALEHLQSLADAGEAWPSPTPIESIPAPAGAWAMLVDLPVEDTPVRVNISVGERLLQRLDAAAEARGMTRSGFIAQAVRMSLGEQVRGGMEFDVVGRRIQDELAALGRRMAEFDDKLLDGVRRAADNVSAAVARRKDAQRSAGADRPQDSAV
jgi:hypothetical protein